MKKVFLSRAFPRRLDFFFKGFERSEIIEIFQDLCSYPYDNVTLEENGNPENPYIKLIGGQYSQDNALGKLMAKGYKIIDDCRV